MERLEFWIAVLENEDVTITIAEFLRETNLIIANPARKKEITFSFPSLRRVA
jgi:hypothetical protein